MANGSSQEKNEAQTTSSTLFIDVQLDFALLTVSHIILIYPTVPLCIKDITIPEKGQPCLHDEEEKEP